MPLKQSFPFGVSEKREIEDFIRAVKILNESPYTLSSATERLNYITACEEWLRREQAWKTNVYRWLTAEREFHSREQRFDDATYAAARAGWNQVKAYVPKLDGCNTFESLSDSLQFRYAAFAAAVMGKLPPAEIASRKQELERTESSC